MEPAVAFVTQFGTFATAVLRFFPDRDAVIALVDYFGCDLGVSDEYQRILV